MRFTSCRAAGLALLSTLAASARADTWWVPAVAHAPGVGGASWRSDVTILNLCATRARVTLRLHVGGALVTKALDVEAGGQERLADVVGQSVSGDAVGALEVVADRAVAVTSRTWDASSSQPGTVLEGVAAEEGLSAGAFAHVPALAESGARRTNVGVLNTGAAEAEVEVILADANGLEVGRFSLLVPPATTVQDDRPFRTRFGRGDVESGSARVRVVSGSGVVAWASVIDQATGSALVLRARKARDACPAPDVAAVLSSIPGVQAVEAAPAPAGYRRFDLTFRQPADHAHPGGAGFDQRITLLHRSFDAPVVVETLGYAMGRRDSRGELAGLLDGNQLLVEHRFFGGSRPSPADWRLLTIEQAAEDLHEVARALHPFYRGRWLATGRSKGGMTAIYFRRFHPEDVDGTVAYVAPNSLGAPDGRYPPFLANAGPEACRGAVEAIQRELLRRRGAMTSRLAATGYAFSRIGGRDAALDAAALDLPFTFWQYTGVGGCDGVPPPTATDDEVYAFADATVGFDSASDPFFDAFEAYFYQARTQLGFPELARSNVADLLRTENTDLESGLLPAGTTAAYDPAPMRDVAAWLGASGRRVLFVYGQWDPWTAGAFDPAGAADTHVFVRAAGTHGSVLGTLAPADRAQAFSILERWTGVSPAIPPASPSAEPPGSRRDRELRPPL